MDKIPQGIKLSCSGILSSMACSSRLVPSRLSLFCFILSQGKPVRYSQIHWLAWTIHANWNIENCSVLFLKQNKTKRKEKYFSFFPFWYTKWDGGEAQRGASYHLGWKICSALLSSLFHHLHLSSITIMKLVNIEMKLLEINSRIAEEHSVWMTFSSFCGQGGCVSLGGGREG